MFRCAGVVLVLALAFFAQEVPGDPLLDAYGIIQGVVMDEEIMPIGSATVTAYETGTTILIDDDITDSDGQYTLLIPLDGQDADTVDVEADKSGYISEKRSDIIVEFLEVDTLNFVLKQQAQIIAGAVRDSVFETGIESVYVSAEGSEMSKHTHTNSTGRYWFEGLEAGEYYISFTHPDFLPEDSTVTIVVSNFPYPLYDTLEQVIWHVDTTGDDENGDGRGSNPFAAIQKGIDRASTDDTVLVWPGTYTGDDNRDITLNGPRIVLISAMGPESTIIDVDADSSFRHRGIFAENDPGSTISGFMIINGWDSDGAGVLFTDSSSTTIENCIIRGNTANQWGGGIGSETSHPTIRSCIITDNYAKQYGGGIGFMFTNGQSPRIENCTITRNAARNSGGAIRIVINDPIITNCIVWGNYRDEIDILYSTPVITYCDVQGGWDGDGNFDHNPWFCDPDSGDFTLAENSICLGRGCDPEGNPDPNVDVGARGVGECGLVGVIMGTVVDSLTGLVLDNALAVATSSAGIVRKDSMNSDGDYELPIPGAPGTVDIVFSCNGYRDTTIFDVPFFPSDTTLLDTVRMTSGCHYIPGDCDNDGTPCTLADVLCIIAVCRGHIEPYFTCSCPPHGDAFPATVDPNGNCIPCELADVITEICCLRGTCEAYGCVDCPGTGPPPPPGKEGTLIVPSLKSKARIERGGLAE